MKFRFKALAPLLLPSMLASCSSSDAAPGDAAAVAVTAEDIAIACNDTLDSLYKTPDSLPKFDQSLRGQIVRCSFEKAISAGELEAAAEANGYRGPKLASGTKVYRIAYRTERSAKADGTTQDGLSSALVFLPDNARAKSAHPLVVIGHGSVGIADKCAPSRGDVAKVGTLFDDAYSLYLPIAGYGFVAIAPDYAGFGYGKTSAWLDAKDEAQSMLDSTRAMHKFLKPGVLGSKVAMVGHSQGGHAALSAHAYAKSYGLEGDLVGVGVYAPFWFVGRSWGAALSPIGGLTTAKNAGTIAYSMDYFIGHGALYDGPDQAYSMFNPAKVEAVRELMSTKCLIEREEGIVALGEKPGDIFDADFAKTVGMCGITNTCTEGASATWGPRFAVDRPKIDTQGPPIVFWHGGSDTSITPARAKCGLDRIDKDLKEPNTTTSFTFCGDPQATHGSIMPEDLARYPLGITRRQADWMNQWLGSKLLGETAPPVCEGISAITPATGELKCDPLPSNDD